MLKTTRLAALAILGAIAASPTFAETNNAKNETASITKVNGVAIPQARIDFIVKSATAQGQQDTPELRKSVKDNLITNEILAQEAVKNGVDKQPDFIQTSEIIRQKALVQAFIEGYIKNHPLSEDAIAKEYDNLKSSLGTKEYHVRHILVETENEAKAIAAKLKKGGKEGSFDKLAKAHSKDPGSKEHGGDLDWIPVSKIPSAFVKPFGDALMKLSKGQLSEPVQSQFGWHIIELEDVRDLKVPPLNEIKPQLTQRLQQQLVKQMVDELRDKAKIE